jgi:hypothetical protein
MFEMNIYEKEIKKKKRIKERNLALLFKEIQTLELN